MESTNRSPTRLGGAPRSGVAAGGGTPIYQTPSYHLSATAHPAQAALSRRPPEPTRRNWPIVLAIVAALAVLGVPAIRHLGEPPSEPAAPEEPTTLTLLESMKAEPTFPAERAARGASPAVSVAALEPRDSPAAAEAPPDPPPVSRKPFQVLDVTLGREVDADNAVVEARDRFLPLDEIHASVQTEGSTKGTDLSIRWMTADGRSVASDTRTLVATGPTRHDFKIQHPTGWPVGSYVVEVAVDGTTVIRRSFDVH